MVEKDNKLELEALSIIGTLNIKKRIIVYFILLKALSTLIFSFLWNWTSSIINLQNTNSIYVRPIVLNVL